MFRALAAPNCGCQRALGVFVRLKALRKSTDAARRLHTLSAMMPSPSNVLLAPPAKQDLRLHRQASDDEDDAPSPTSAPPKAAAPKVPSPKQAPPKAGRGILGARSPANPSTWGSVYLLFSGFCS